MEIGVGLVGYGLGGRVIHAPFCARVTGVVIVLRHFNPALVLLAENSGCEDFSLGLEQIDLLVEHEVGALACIVRASPHGRHFQVPHSSSLRNGRGAPRSRPALAALGA
jgi:hypothetical protein